MKLKTFAALTAATMIITACGGETAEAPVVKAITAEAEAAGPLGTLDQRLSYIVGENIAMQFKRDGIKLDLDALSLSIKDIQEEKELRLTEEEKRNTISAIQERAQELQKAEQEVAAAKNAEEGLAYLTANGAKEGVVTTASGLQYKEVTAGAGDKPTAEDNVTVHYKGMLVDGTVFDSSYDRGEPASFPVGGVIPGWIEALQLMNVGDKFELAIPSDLAYGPGGTGPVIGPNATLVFEVELLEIAKVEKPADAAAK